MEILSNNLCDNKYNKVSVSSKKVCKGVNKCLEVSTGSKKYDKPYITVNLLGKTWKVKSDAESKWLKVANVESWLRENLSDIVGGAGVFILGYMIYCLMVMFG